MRRIGLRSALTLSLFPVAAGLPIGGAFRDQKT